MPDPIEVTLDTNAFCDCGHRRRRHAIGPDEGALCEDCDACLGFVFASWTPKSEECDSCGWKTTELTECDAYARTQGHGPFTPEAEKERAWLCEVCRSTDVGNVHLYPRNYPREEARLLRTIAWGINHIASVVRGDRADARPL